MKKKLWMFLSLLLIAAMLLSACEALNEGLGGNAPAPTATVNVFNTEVAQTVEAEVANLTATAQAELDAQALPTETLAPQAAVNVVTATPAPANTKTPVPSNTSVPPTATTQPTNTVAPTITATALPTFDFSKVDLSTDPNKCPIKETIELPIKGENIDVNGVIYMNSALGADGCAALLEGRWYEGFAPDNIHHISVYYGPAENASVYQGTQRLFPVLISLRDSMYNHALGKCDNWAKSNEASQPIVFDYIDVKESKLVHSDPPFTCDQLKAGNPLPDKIGLIPGLALPHFAKGYTWAGTPIAQAVSAAVAQGIATTGGTYDGKSSKFDAENRGMSCNTAQNPLLGNNDVGLAKIDKAWDSQCIYLLDGNVDGKRAIGLIKGVDIKNVKFDASVWSVPATWVALKWADDFGRDNCPAAPPIKTYDGKTWQVNHTYNCPGQPTATSTQ
jgi:hypothetical protein